MSTACRPSSRRPARTRAVALALLLLAGACGRGREAPREEKVEFMEQRLDVGASPGHGVRGAPDVPPRGAFPAPPAREEADFAGTGVAGGTAAAVAEPPLAGAPVLTAPAAPAAPGAPGAPGSSALLVRTGQVSVEVDSLEPAVAALRALAARLGGVVTGLSVATGRDQLRAATLQLRVPAARFDEAVGGLRPLGRVERVDVDAQDVGEEWVDVGARIANARRLEARLLELLATRTGRLADVLAVERELARVREGIERQEGRLRWLREHVVLSTIAVAVHEPLPLAGPRPVSAPLAEAVREAWRNFLALLGGTIAALGFVVPVVATVGALAAGWTRLRRARRARGRDERPAPAVG